jgi:SP family galactose:H+ symporter-like MFS transporter
MGIAMLILSASFGLNIHNEFFKVLDVLSIVAFLVPFAFSAGPIAWLLCAEIFPLKGRDFGMAVATSTNWICNFFLALVFLTVLNKIGSGNTFLIFAVFNLACLFVVFRYIPETKGISLEQIEKNLLAGNKLRDIGLHK